MCGAAKLVALGVPQEIEQEKLRLALAEPCTAPHHLAVQTANFGRAEHHNAVYRGAVPALCKQHTVAEHVVLALIKSFQYLCPFLALAVYLSRHKTALVQNIAKLLRGLDERQKYHRLALGAVFEHFVSYLIQIGV